MELAETLLNLQDKVNEMEHMLGWEFKKLGKIKWIYS